VLPLKKLDACDVCGGNNTCIGCDGQKYPLGTPPVEDDACGVCGGDNSTCAGCDGLPNSNTTYDRCGICGGNDSCINNITNDLTPSALTPAGIAGIAAGVTIGALVGIIAPIAYMLLNNAVYGASWYLPASMANSNLVTDNPLYKQTGNKINPLAKRKKEKSKEEDIVTTNI